MPWLVACIASAAALLPPTGCSDGGDDATGPRGTEGILDAGALRASPVGPVEVSDTEREEACACLTRAGIVPEGTGASECEGEADGRCVRCVLERAEGDACEQSLVVRECLLDCHGGVPPPTTPDDCVQMTEPGELAADYPDADCVCKRCLRPFGACMVDPDCAEMMRCCLDAGVIGNACHQTVRGSSPIPVAGGLSGSLEPGPCVDLISEVLIRNTNAVLVLMEDLSSCSDDHGCGFE